MVNRLAVVATPLLATVAAVTSSGAVVFAEPAQGRVAVNVSLDAPADSAARTWRFELVDATGTVTRTISVPLSGELPDTVAAIEDVPQGDYTLRPVFSSDLGSDCATGAHFRVNSEAASVPVRPTGTGASFTISACEMSASTDANAITASMPADLRPFGEPTASLAIGSGAEAHTTRNNVILAAGIAAITAAFAGLRFLLARTSPRS